ncbi:hypothetical protein FDZ74_04710, partial [bacterium]
MKKSMILSAATGFLLLLAACTPGAAPLDTNNMNTAIAATVDAALVATLAVPPKVFVAATPEPSDTATAAPTAATDVTTQAPVGVVTGLKVAYTDGQGNLWLLQDGETPQQLVDTKDVVDFALSPDGSQVFYSRALNYRDFSLWLVDGQGGSPRRVMSPDEFEAMPRPAQASGTAPAQLTWVPGSTTAVFTTYHFFDGPGSDMSKDLYLVNGASGAVSTLLQAGQGGGMYFYSPDGNQIALVNPNQIDLIDSDGSNRRAAVLRYEDVLMYTEAPFYAQPVWSADGTKLRVIILAADRMGKPEDPSSVWEIPAAGGAATKLLDFHLNGLGPGAAISPDLQRLAYFQNVTTGGQQDLHIATLDGGADQVYASGSLNWVTW